MNTRRKFITLLGGAAAGWPFATWAQQSAKPVIGFFHLTSLDTRRNYLAAFHRGLADAGYTEGKNVNFEYKWAHGQNDRLPGLAAELVRENVTMIVILESTHGALAAKAATQTIPIVFMQGADPVKVGLVESLNRPGGNLTGINLFLSEVVAKRLQLLVELASATKPIGYLRNPTNPVFAESETREVETAARALGVRLIFTNASHASEVENAVKNLIGQVGAMLVSGDGLLTNTLRDQIAVLAARHEIPAIYAVRDCVLAGGLMSYGVDLPDAWRQAGAYTGRVLKGERPVDLPVQQVTKIDLVLNLKAAHALGITFPLSLLARADEVIE